MWAMPENDIQIHKGCWIAMLTLRRSLPVFSDVLTCRRACLQESKTGSVEQSGVVLGVGGVVRFYVGCGEPWRERPAFRCCMTQECKALSIACTAFPFVPMDGEACSHLQDRGAKRRTHRTALKIVEWL